jgi:hypothetical protein
MSETMAQMGEEQMWAFELDGYILLPNLLGAAAAAHATPTALAEHAGLLAAIDQLAGGQVPLWYRAAYDGTEGKEQAFHTIQFALDRPPGRLTKEGQWANDLTVDEQRRLGYDTTSRPDRAYVWGLRALWAVDDSCVVVCPASHKANVHPPPSMSRAEELEATERVQLSAGDCLLAVATTLVGAVPGSALQECIFCDNTRFPGGASGHSTKRANSWIDELTPERRALVAGPPRGFGHDGQLLSNEQQLAPSLLSINGRPDAPDREEVWFWDLRGYLVLHNVMDRAWLAQCNAALDSPFAQANRRPVELSNSVVGTYPDYEGCSQTIAPAPGTRCTEERVSQTWAHPSPFSDGFRRMIDNPLVNARLAWMIDPGFVMTTCYTIVSRNGAAGQPLHSGWFYGAGHTYHFRDGQPRTEQVNIGWLLQDVETATGDGGLMLVPGSHKARRPLPRPKQTSCDLPQVKHMQGVAGTVIMYAGTTTHGVRSWRNPHRERRFVNTKAGPNIRRPAPDPGQPSP